MFDFSWCLTIQCVLKIWLYALKESLTRLFWNIEIYIWGVRLAEIEGFAVIKINF